MSLDQSLAIKTDAASVLAEVQRTFREVFKHIPGANRRPKDLQLLLGVEYKLCWQVMNIVRAEDPLAVSQYVPGITSVRKFLAATRPLGISEGTIADVESAMTAFNRVVDAHSDDRRGFDSMVASLSGGDGAELITLQHRRDAFRSESQIWGSQVKTYLLQMFASRAKSGPGFDRCYVSAKFGLRRLRHNVMPVIHGHRDSSTGVVAAELALPLDEAAAKKYGALVIGKFCTQPIPDFHTVKHSNGYIYTTLAAAEIGRKSAVNMVFGGVNRNQQVERDDSGAPALLCGAGIIAPTELAVVELLVHRPTFGELVPELHVQSTASASDVLGKIGLTQQFQIHERVESLGNAAEIDPVPEAPSYQRQLDYVFQKQRWDASEFDVFRLRMAYPILHTRVRIVCPVTI